MVYKTIDGQELRLDLFAPETESSAGPKAAFIAIHGGGWAAGAPRSMYGLAAWAAKHGMVGMSVQYRLYRPKTDRTVFHSVQDARSAIRYIRQHAADFGIDPSRLIVSGASAGGHLAVAAALFDRFDEPGEDTSVSCVPNALVLLTPVIDTSAEGYGQAKIGPRWQELSPAHQVRPGMPPVLLLHGEADTTTPFKGALDFFQAMAKEGNRCELIAVAGAPHTYMFKDAALYAESLVQIKAFLRSQGVLPAASAP